MNLLEIENQVSIRHLTLLFKDLSVEKTSLIIEEVNKFLILGYQVTKT